MSTKIGIMSDLHAALLPLQDALKIFEKNQVDHILCGGDIVGYGDEIEATVECLMASPAKSIFGNHDLWFLETNHADQFPRVSQFIKNLPATVTLDVEGLNLFMVHAHPPLSNRGGIKLLDVEANVSPTQKQNWTKRLATYDFDILVVGHSHQVYAEQLGDVLLINPGSTKFNHTCAILHLPEKKVEFFALCGETPSRIWNWSQSLLNP